MFKDYTTDGRDPVTQYVAKLTDPNFFGILAKKRSSKPFEEITEDNLTPTKNWILSKNRKTDHEWVKHHYEQMLWENYQTNNIKPNSRKLFPLK